MVKKVQTSKTSAFEKISLKMTRWVGTPQSLIIHTIIFIAVPSLSFFGLDFRAVSLILTTWLSMEAIYLAIFIQMTVNRNTASIEDIEEDIEDIQEDVEELSEDVEDIGEDIDKIQVEDKKEEDKVQSKVGQKGGKRVTVDEGKLGKIMKGISDLANKNLL